MTTLQRLLLVLTASCLLAACHTGIDSAVERANAPADALRDDPVPPPVTSSGLRPALETSACTPAEEPPCPITARAAQRPRRFPRGEVYAGLTVVAVPAIGVGLEFGQRFSRTRTADWAFEMQAAWQDLGAAVCCDTSGTFAQIAGGVKATFRPLSRSHPVLRGGFGWFRSTGSTELVETPGDYVSLYVGAGWEWDITPTLTTGPEVRVMLASIEKEFDPIVVPQVQWHLVWRF